MRPPPGKQVLDCQNWHRQLRQAGQAFPAANQGNSFGVPQAGLNTIQRRISIEWEPGRAAVCDTRLRDQQVRTPGKKEAHNGPGSRSVITQRCADHLPSAVQLLVADHPLPPDQRRVFRHAGSRGRKNVRQAFVPEQIRPVGTTQDYRLLWRGNGHATYLTLQPAVL